MWDLAGNPEDRFSRVEAQILTSMRTMPQFLQSSFNLFEAICLTEKLIKSMKLEIHF